MFYSCSSPTTLINISVNNIDLDNITSVNISLPISFNTSNEVAHLCDILNGYCGSDTDGTLWYNDTDLGWYLNPGLVLPGNTNNFWFKVMPTESGYYNITVTTSNSTGDTISYFTSYVAPPLGSSNTNNNQGSVNYIVNCDKDTIRCADNITYVGRNSSNNCNFNSCPIINNSINKKSSDTLFIIQGIKINTIGLIIGGTIIIIGIISGFILNKIFSKKKHKRRKK